MGSQPMKPDQTQLTFKAGPGELQGLCRKAEAPHPQVNHISFKGGLCQILIVFPVAKSSGNNDISL